MSDPAEDTKRLGMSAQSTDEGAVSYGDGYEAGHTVGYLDGLAQGKKDGTIHAFKQGAIDLRQNAIGTKERKKAAFICKVAEFLERLGYKYEKKYREEANAANTKH